MKRGFVLISTLALIVILSFVVLIISRTIYTDTLRTTFYAESMEKRIQIINYESLLVDLLIDNSTLNRNLLFAENEINLILKDKFDTLKKLKLVETPILIMHGKKDKIVPFNMGLRIYESANNPKFNYFNSNDDHMMDFNEDMINTLKNFIKYTY